MVSEDQIEIREETMNRRCLLSLIAVATVLPLSPAISEPLQLRVNYSVVPPHLVPVLFMKKDLIKHEGKSYANKYIYTRGSAIVMQALAAGEMDLGVLSVPAFANGIMNAKQPLVAIADLTQDGPWFSAVFAVKEDSPIRSVKDLKGKTFGTNAVGGGLDGAVRAMLLKHGLEPDKDVRFVEAGFGAQEAMLRENKVDAATFAAPFWARAQAKGGLRPLFTMKDAIGNNQHLFWVARKDVLTKHRVVLTDFFEDYIRAQRWAMKAENRNEMLEMMGKFTKRPAASFGWALKEGSGYYRGKDLRLDRETFQRTADALHKVGFLKAKFDITPHLDESIVIEAAKRVK
jgi:sulfonate transport system substrate-binding protein